MKVEGGGDGKHLSEITVLIAVSSLHDNNLCQHYNQTILGTTGQYQLVFDI